MTLHPIVNLSFNTIIRLDDAALKNLLQGLAHISILETGTEDEKTRLEQIANELGLPIRHPQIDESEIVRKSLEIFLLITGQKIDQFGQFISSISFNNLAEEIKIYAARQNPLERYHINMGHPPQALIDSFINKIVKTRPRIGKRLYEIANYLYQKHQIKTNMEVLVIALLSNAVRGLFYHHLGLPREAQSSIRQQAVHIFTA